MTLKTRKIKFSLIDGWNWSASFGSKKSFHPHQTVDGSFACLMKKGILN